LARGVATGLAPPWPRRSRRRCHLEAEARPPPAGSARIDPGLRRRSGRRLAGIAAPLLPSQRPVQTRSPVRRGV